MFYKEGEVVPGVHSLQAKELQGYPYLQFSTIHFLQQR